MSEKPLIWITRPEPDAVATAREWQAAGWETLVAPLMRIEHWMDRQAALETLLKRQPQAMLVTSRQAVEAAQHLQLPALPLHAAGSRTAAAARQSGLFSDVTELAAPATKTASAHFTNFPASPLLYLCGRHEAGDLTATLAPQGVEVLKLPIYEALLATELPEAARKAIHYRKLSAVAVYSRRAASLLRQLLLNAGLGQETTAIELFCLGDPIAEHASHLPWRAVHIADVPKANAMIKKA